MRHSQKPLQATITKLNQQRRDKFRPYAAVLCKDCCSNEFKCCVGSLQIALIVNVHFCVFVGLQYLFQRHFSINFDRFSFVSLQLHFKYKIVVAVRRAVVIFLAVCIAASAIGSVVVNSNCNSLIGLSLIADFSSEHRMIDNCHPRSIAMAYCGLLYDYLFEFSS